MRIEGINVRTRRALVCAGLAIVLGAGCGDGTGADTSGETRDTTATGDGVEDPGAAWTDPSSGLTWQVLPSYPELAWDAAAAHCAGLVLGGHDDWRLPTISELRTLLRGCPDTVSGGPCQETDSCTGAGPTCYDGQACMGCQDGDGPGENGCFWPTEMGAGCDWTWSSSAADDVAGYACFAHFRNGHLSHDDERNDIGHHALCVRR